MVVRRAQTSGQPLIRVLLVLTEICSLCLPSLINNAPLVYPDTRSYYMGGRAAIDKIASLFAHHEPGTGSDSVEATLQKARGVRSAFYSLFTYVPAVSVSLWLVIVLQAAIVAAMLRLVYRLACPGRQRWQATAFIVTLSLLTTVSWVTSNVMPDIFTSITALGIIVAIIYWNDLSKIGRGALFFAIAGCLVMHVTNLPIATGLLIVAAVVMQQNVWRERGRYLLVVGAQFAGVSAMLMVGVVGFHQWSIAPQSPPFLLGRSIEDGPGRLYLQEHCPQIGLTMCHHLDKLDQNIETFIWDQQKGVYSTASTEEEAQLRAEDKRIYIAAALEHPWMQVTAMARNAFLQLITFSLHEYYIPSWADYNPSDMTLHMPDQAPWQTELSIVEYLVVIGSLGFICIRGLGPTHSVPRPLKQLSMLVIATALLEAMAGAISEPVPRYEARVIWLIPMAALLIWSSSRQTDRA
jgi:hypothetical protein